MTELCVDFGGTNVKLGYLDAGEPVSREFAVTGTAADLSTVEATARELLAEAASPVTGIGIALPGVVDQDAGRLVAAHGKYGYLDNIDMRDWAQTRFGAPAAVENDARAALVGETTAGCAIGARDAVMVTLGTGIGTAAIIGGHLLRGAHDHAGILGGHMTVDIDGDRCPCGNIGCAETLASTWALESRLRRHPQHEISALWGPLTSGSTVGLKDVIGAAEGIKPDVVAGDILAEFIRVWGAVIVTLCHAYDPNVVIVSGGVLRARESLLPQLEAYLHEHLWSSSHRPAVISPQAPELSVLRGLSVIAREAAQARRTGDNV